MDAVQTSRVTYSEYIILILSVCVYFDNNIVYSFPFENFGSSHILSSMMELASALRKFRNFVNEGTIREAQTANADDEAAVAPVPDSPGVGGWMAMCSYCQKL